MANFVGEKRPEVRYASLMSSSEKQRVVVLSVFASLGLTITKFTAGLATGSLGILSEAIHSLIDLGATIVTWFAVRWSDQPPDEEHHYGHAKAESVAALIETGLLFLTTAWIVYEAVKRLIAGQQHIDVTWWAVAIIGGSILVDFSRARALSRVAHETSSEALEADALHFSSDMWSSAVVLLGLVAVWLGFPMADAGAAIIVSFFVGLAGWRLGKRTLATLLDTAPAGATAELRSLIEHTSGVLHLSSLRLRPAGPILFTSAVVEVPRTMPVDDIVKLKDTLTEKIMEKFPSADVTVTVNPVTLDDETVFQRVMLIASRRNLAIHHLTVQEIKGRLAVSFDLEVDGLMPLVEAHEYATQLEDAIRSELGPGVEVESHIEPQPERLLTGKDAPAKTSNAIISLLKTLAMKQPRLSDLHNIRIRENDQGLFVHYHCRFAPTETVDDVHTTVDQIENGLQAKFPAIRRVIAHAEPIGRVRHGN
jgi:cation diffusion facilitator family transporter